MTHCRNALLALALSASALNLSAQTAPPEPMRLGGFFVGADAGSSSRLRGANQQYAAVDMGYRWALGSATLLGFEVAAGKDKERFGSVGLNARFNFGSGNPVFGRVRAGFWGNGGSGGPFLFGAIGGGVDVGRHVSLVAAFSTYQHRGETLTAGLEMRF